MTDRTEAMDNLIAQDADLIEMTEEEIDNFENYDQRAEATLAYRLMEHLAFRGLITDIEVSNLRFPPCELIVDAEEAWDE